MTVALVEEFGYGTLVSVALKPLRATSSVNVAHAVAGNVSTPLMTAPTCDPLSESPTSIAHDPTVGASMRRITLRSPISGSSRGRLGEKLGVGAMEMTDAILPLLIE